MDRETPDVIEAELAATREALAAKLDAAEFRTVGAVKETVEAIQEEVKTVQETVADTVGSVRQEAVAGVRDVLHELDPRHTIRRNPYGAVGGAVLGGLVVGLFAFRNSTPRQVTAAAKGTDTRESPLVGERPAAQESRAAGIFPAGGFFDRLADTVQGELQKACSEVAGMVTTAVQQQIHTLKQTVTEKVTEQTQNLTDRVTNLIPSVLTKDEPKADQPAATKYAAG